MEWLYPPVFFDNLWWGVGLVVLALGIVWRIGSFILAFIRGSRHKR